MSSSGVTNPDLSGNILNTHNSYKNKIFGGITDCSVVFKICNSGVVSRCRAILCTLFIE